MTNLDSILKIRDITLPTKVCLVKIMGFPVSPVWMWELECKETWALRNWYFCTVVLEKTFESPLHCKEIKLVHLKGNQSWIFIGRTDAETETPILWPPGAKNWLLEETLMLGKLKAGGEGEDRGWHGWMALLTQWTWVWARSWSLWWTGKPGVLQSMGSKTFGHDWTELNWKLSCMSQNKGQRGVGGIRRWWLTHIHYWYLI